MVDGILMSGNESFSLFEIKYISIKAWINSWIELIEELANYVEDFHRSGLKWNR